MKKLFKNIVLLLALMVSLATHANELGISATSTSIVQPSASDSVILLLEGEWIFYKSENGFCQCQSFADPNNEIKYTFQKDPNSSDTVVFKKYTNNILEHEGKSKVYQNSSFGVSGWFIDNLRGNNDPHLIVLSNSNSELAISLPIAPDAGTDHYVKSKVTPANVGNDFALVGVCEFNYEHTVLTNPSNGESCNWEVITGQAVFEFADNGDLTVFDATNSVVDANGRRVIKLVYFITNSIQYTRDTLELHVVDKGCAVYIDKGNNLIDINCGIESDPLEVNIIEPNNSIPPSDKYNYVWSTNSSNLTINSPNSYSTTFEASSSGWKTISLNVYTKNFNHLIGSATYDFFVVCDDKVTKAIIGEPNFLIDVCDFSYFHSPLSTPKANEQATWTLLSGSADFEFSPNGDLILFDALDDTKLVYTITNGSKTSSDTTLLTILQNNNCVEIDLAKNPTVLNCEEMSALIFAKVKGSIQNTSDYSFAWSSTSDGIEITNPNEFSTKIKISTPGTKKLRLDVYSSNQNLIGYDEIEVQSNCEDKKDKTIIITDCQFPYYHQYATPQPSDSVIWEVETGSAELMQEPNLLTIKKATEGTVLLMRTYHNLNSTTQKYTISITGNCPKETFTVEGYVWANNNLWQHGKIYLLKKDKTEPLDSMVFNNGVFFFDKVEPGTYTLYAVPYEEKSLTTISSDFAPTYYFNKQYKSEANTFDISGDTFELDLELMSLLTASTYSNAPNTYKIYPNPFVDQLQIKGSTDAKVEIYNAVGSLIYENSLNDLQTINTLDWKGGSYLIKVTDQNSTYTYKVLK